MLISFIITSMESVTYQ